MANKALGQHWLNNRAILNEIADLAKGSARNVNLPEGLLKDATAEEIAEKTEVKTCLEIGPGLGTLTSSLLKRFKKVVAVEFDKKLADNLPKSFPGKNLVVINEDILKYDFSEIEEDYVVAGNIPYYITSPILEKILSVSNLPKRVVLLMQKEVAERVVSEKETMLSLMVKNRAKASLGPVVLKGEFTPPPKVDSQVLILEPHEPIVQEEVFDLIKKGFFSPRKKLIHNLVQHKSKDELRKIFQKYKINVDARPGDLKLEEWELLYRNMI